MKEGGNEKEIQHMETNPAGGKRTTVSIYVPWLAQTLQHAVAAF